MNPFNPYIMGVKDYIDELYQKGRTFRVWFVDNGTPIPKSSAISQWPRVLQEDTAVELGGPLTAGTVFFLGTDDASLISDGRITLVGPDIVETMDRILPFGQVVLVAGPTLTKGINSVLETKLYMSSKIPGYMVRSTQGHIWSRVSHQAKDNGFSLKSLGGTILNNIHANLIPVSVAEVLFVTSNADDVHQLNQIGIKVRTLAHDLRRERIKQSSNGVLQCELGGDCDICTNSEVCAAT